MWFKELENKMFSITSNFIKSTAETLSNSNFTVNSKEELAVLIKKSSNKSFLDKETNKKKEFIKRSIVIFWDEKTDFFKNALYMLPVLWTKSFSQNIYIKLARSDIEGIKMELYWVNKLPSMVVFENEKVIKLITSEKDILKVVKSISLDINKTIDNI